MVSTTYKNGDSGDGLWLFYPHYMISSDIFVDLQLQSLGSRAIIKYYIILYNYVFFFKPRNQTGGTTL